MLGLTHLALPFYEEVLREEEEALAGKGKGKEGDEVMIGGGWSGGEGKGGGREDLVVEAAFNLQGIFTVAGNMGLAKRVTDRWLVI